jgi:tetratricopeptide (TPR) repeat protein
MKFKRFTAFLFITFFIFPSFLRSQTKTTDLPEPYSIYRQKMAQGDYLGAYLALKKNEAEYKASPQFARNFLQLMSIVESQIGEYDAAHGYLDEFFSRQIKTPQKDLETSPIDDFAPRRATDAIAAAAEKNQVIMINEEHDTPMHRAFTARLLPVLYAKGFRYLAAETVMETDAELNKRGYPTLKTGFYTPEPVYGDMIRAALKLGFKIVPYEYMKIADCKNPADNEDFCQNERERGQAQNLYERILKPDPKAKILVHVGRGHNQKGNFGSWAMMAWHFKEISKIDPYTIGQMHLSERSRPENEFPLYRYATAKWKFTEPTVFQAKDGKFWSESLYDLTIFHPRTIYKKGRPTWLEMGGARKSLALYGKVENQIAQPFLPQTGGTFLVQAFVADEPNDAIPVDQIIVTDAKKAPVLMLPIKGDFRIRAIDESGKTVVETNVSIK